MFCELLARSAPFLLWSCKRMRFLAPAQPTGKTTPIERENKIEHVWRYMQGKTWRKQKHCATVLFTLPRSGDPKLVLTNGC